MSTFLPSRIDCAKPSVSASTLDASPERIVGTNTTNAHVGIEFKREFSCEATYRPLMDLLVAHAYLFLPYLQVLDKKTLRSTCQPTLETAANNLADCESEQALAQAGLCPRRRHTPPPIVKRCPSKLRSRRPLLAPARDSAAPALQLTPRVS